MKKYELTNEKTTIKGITLYRIRAIKNFKNIKAGDLGGWVQSEKNLSQKGNCWIHNEAKVYENAYVFEEALIYDNAILCGYAKVFGCAKVYNDGYVYGSAVISQNARIYDEAMVRDAKIFGHARLHDKVKILGDVMVYGDAVIRDHTTAFDNAEIFGKVLIHGFARITRDAKISKPEDIICINNVGSERRTLTAFKTETGIGVTRGCFFGTLNQFKRAVDEKHGDNRFGKEYKMLIEFIETRLGILD